MLLSSSSSSSSSSCQEAHYLKNKDSARAKELLPILESAERTILLTGTPALNCPAELWTLVHTLRPDVFQVWEDYANYFCERKLVRRGRRFVWDERGAAHLGELHEKLQLLMVRRRKEDVLTQLPAKHRRTVVVKLQPQQANHLAELQAELRRLDIQSEQQQANRGNWQAMSQLGEMWRAAGLAKVPALREYLQDLLAGASSSGHGKGDSSSVAKGKQKMIVFAHHLNVLDEAQKVAVSQAFTSRLTHQWCLTQLQTRLSMSQQPTLDSCNVLSRWQLRLAGYASMAPLRRKIVTQQ